MRRRWLSLLLCLHVCLCALAVASLVATAQTFSLRVNEAATRVSLAGGQSKISLAVENNTSGNAPAHIKLELLDPHDKVVARTRRREMLKPGANVVAAFMPVSNLARSGNDFKQLLWLRLRYEITPADGSPRQGIISLSEITPDLFELDVAAASNAGAGQLYRVRVRATHPLTSRPVRGVEVAAEVVLDDGGEEGKSGALRLSGATGRDGYVTLDFNLPTRIETDEGEIKVSGRRGDVVRTASDGIEINRMTRILLTSDKPLYQPGQTLHLRALMLNHATRRAVADAAATLKIEDPEGTTVFNAPLKTSRFGVASCDWPIPDNTRLGDYRVKVSADDDNSHESQAWQLVKISRYELPNFAVSATPDRGYYLPGESAQVEVRGDYLFGQPLKRGRVRVVRETEREWNYKEQKYDTREGDKQEGELGADGSFRVRLNLSQGHAELANNSWQRFSDLNYAAYVIDPTTNRTEQRRFRVRLSKEPIHIYVTQGNYRQAARLPLAFYVSTSYADGTPASCELTLTHTQADDGDVKMPAAIKTNSYGVAKVVGSTLPAGENESFNVQFTARDRAGREGRHTENFWITSQPVVRVETDKTIYRAGEGITARVSSNQADMKILLDIVCNGRVVATQSARLRGGSALIELPYRPEFQNRVTLAAYTTDFPKKPYEDYAHGARTLVYPRNRELKFDVRMSRASYQPGEEAAAGVRVRNAAGRDVESALGVVVFDKAVEERARTEQEFGSSYGFSNYFYQFWYGLESIGGLGLRDIEQLDAARALPEGLETVADLLLQRDEEYYRPNFFSSTESDPNQAQVFAALASAQLQATRDALAARHNKSAEHPTDEASLRRLLSGERIALEELRDPWGIAYRPVFSVERAEDVLEFKSAGADKQHGTDDDWVAARFNWYYFRPTGEAFNRAHLEHHKRTGGFIRDAATLKSELARSGLNPAALLDRWGNPYVLNFEINGTNYATQILSSGPDGRLTSTPNNYGAGDDFLLWTTWTDYFTETRARIDAAIDAYLKATKRFPRDESALRDMLRRVGLDPAHLKDPWGHAYYATFHDESRYADRVRIESGGAGQSSTQQRSATPVTRRLEFVTLRSGGADEKPGTADDFNVAVFTRIVSEQSAQDVMPLDAPAALTFSGETGAIGGTVADPSGAVVPGATVTATHQYQTDRVFETKTGEDGKFLLRNLPAGPYTVRVDATGFSQTVAMNVMVYSATLATMNFNLTLGHVSETVTVTADVAVNQTESLSMATTVRKEQGLPPAARKPPISTPRLRKDFPETLYWQPAIETDARGRAELRFKLADNITTWKMSIIGSTETGELGTIEREIRAFQPFFVEHDPPRVLTEGDEISLPVVLRNYLERAQTVALDIKPEDWFTLLGPASKQSNVAAGDAARETFGFRAVSSVKEGLQRITAIGGEASDQIEKPVHVHPDGEELAETTTQILRESSLLEVNLPAEAILRTARAELKIYPNLMAHAIESVEAIMSRPYDCAEQTISSTYPSLLVLRHYRRAGGAGKATPPPIAAKATRYVRQGYERLLSYRSESGGFSYWGRGEPDLALTAYAVRFLTDARDFIDVDESALADAREWLIRQQKADGSWAADAWDKNTGGRRDAILTSYVARVLAMPHADAKAAPQDQNGTQTAAPLRRALAYLAPHTEVMDEPYLIASYALAAIDGGESPEKIARALRRLRALAHDEAGGSYWSLETNTPFHGWGNAGRIETTALAVQALTKAKGAGFEVKGEAGKTGVEVEGGRLKDESKADSNVAPSAPADVAPSARANVAPPLARAPSASAPAPASAPASKVAPRSSDELVDRGLLFLLKNKDRYGVWLSTQATVNVLDALNALSPAGATRGGDDKVVSAAQSQTGAAQTVEVFVNGRSAGAVTLPATHEPANPVSLDLSRLVAVGANRVEIKRTTTGASLAATAQLVTTYYRPWSAAVADGAHDARPQDSRALKLNVAFDRTTAATGDVVTCRVAAERIGHRGYGMLLAEVGLPPGADVDRASLELAMKESGWEFSHYDVLPDRLVVYLWPRAGGTNFQFTFRPRFGLAAKSAPSVVYDYYNPEARAVLAPTKFNFNDKAKPAPAQAKRE
ncbi:MAG: carboxypeptidase regulatory-like domain-containing protein [Acidobacteria bacterium]|nr:carboxypeptidase regulatory-like domain-containing protein [Acidobacteriota bacterium]